MFKIAHSMFLKLCSQKKAPVFIITSEKVKQSFYIGFADKFKF